MINIDLANIEKNLPHLDSFSNYWLFRANGGEFFTDFKLNEYIGISWNEITIDQIKKCNNSVNELKRLLYSLDKYKSKDKNVITNNSEELDLFKFLEDFDIPEISNSIPRKISNAASQLLRFVNDIKINDTVIVPSKNSETLLVGKVTGEPFEFNEEEKDINLLSTENSYKHSGYLKRIPVKWMGSFQRNDADAKLYKLIYSQHTINNANEYRNIINRALFDAYILDDSELHLTYYINKESGISGKALGQFVSCYSKLYELLSNDSEMQVKINVQSPGPVESTAKKIFCGLIAFTLLAIGTNTVYAGGKYSLKFGDFELTIDSNSFASEHRKNKETDLELKEKEKDNLAEREERAYNLAKELKVPVSELNLDLPKNAEKALQNSLNNDPEYKKSLEEQSKH